MTKFLEQINVPTEIKENEAHLLHAVIVEGNFNAQTLETTYKAKVQCFNEKSWEVIEKRLKQLGYSHVYLIHNPKVKTEEKEDTVDRSALIEQAFELGFEGKKNEKNEVYIEFIKKAQEEA